MDVVAETSLETRQKEIDAEVPRFRRPHCSSREPLNIAQEIAATRQRDFSPSGAPIQGGPRVAR